MVDAGASVSALENLRKEAAEVVGGSGSGSGSGSHNSVPVTVCCPEGDLPGLLLSTCLSAYLTSGQGQRCVKDLDAIAYCWRPGS